MTDLQSLLLEQALPLVPFDGWSEHTLSLAAARAGLASTDVARAFPGGVMGCVLFHLEQENHFLADIAAQPGFGALRMHERIERLLFARIAQWAARREVTRRTAGFFTIPWHMAQGATNLAQAADLLWRLAGDSSTDFSYYTRRATLAGIYSGALLFFLNDTSENAEDTCGFVRRRLANVAEFARFKKRIGCA